MKRAAATSAATQESGSMSGAPPHQQERHSIHDDEMSAKTSFPADAAAVGIDSPPGMQRATVSTSRRHIFHVSPMAPSGTSSVAIGGAGLLAGARRALPPPGQSSAEQLESLSMNVLSHAPPPSAASLPRRRGFSPDVSLDASVQQDPAQSSPIERRTRSGHGDQHSAFVVPTATPATAPSAYQGRLGAAAIAAGPRGQGVSRRGGENSILTREHRRGSSSADSGQQHHQHNPTPGSFGSAGGACVGTRGGGSKTEDGPPPARSRRTQEQRQHSHGSPYAQGGRSWESSRESGRGSGNVAESKGSADFGDTEALPRGGEGAAVDGVRTSRSRSPSPPSRVGGLMSTSERLMGSDGRFLSSNDDLGGKTGPSSKGRGSGNISHASPFVHTRWAASGATETPRIMERSEWGQGERGQWTPSATLRRMESTGSAARSARRKRKGSEGAQKASPSSIGPFGEPSAASSGRGAGFQGLSRDFASSIDFPGAPRISMPRSTQSGRQGFHANANPNPNPLVGVGDGVNRGWGGAFFDSMSGTSSFSSFNHNFASYDGHTVHCDSFSGGGGGDRGDGGGGWGNGGGGGGGNNVAAAAAPRGGGAAADSATKPSPSSARDPGSMFNTIPTPSAAAGIAAMVPSQAVVDGGRSTGLTRGGTRSSGGSGTAARSSGGSGNVARSSRGSGDTVRRLEGSGDTARNLGGSDNNSNRAGARLGENGSVRFDGNYASFLMPTPVVSGVVSEVPKPPMPRRRRKRSSKRREGESPGGPRVPDGSRAMLSSGTHGVSFSGAADGVDGAAASFASGDGVSRVGSRDAAGTRRGAPHELRRMLSRSSSKGGEPLAKVRDQQSMAAIAGGRGKQPDRQHSQQHSRQRDRVVTHRDANVELRSAPPKRLEVLAELTTLDEPAEAAPSDLREAWMWMERPAIAKMLNDIADALAVAGFHEEAADLFEKCIEVYVAFGGPGGHGGIAEALNDLGYVLWDTCANPVFIGQDAGEDLACVLMANAEEVFRLALSECLVSPGRDHPLAAVCLSNLADCASARRAYEEATVLLKWALKIRLKRFGWRHLNTAETLRKLGGMQHQQGQLDAAKGCYDRALRIFESILGPNHEDFGSALNLLAVVVGEQGQYLEAENLHRRALTQRRNAGAHGPEDLAPMCYNLGLVVGTNARKGLVSQRADGEAESEHLLREALEVYQKGLGHDHPEVGDCMDKLGAAVAMNGDLPAAETLHREALSILEKSLGDGDPQVAEVLFNLAAVVGAQRERLGETEALLHRCLDAQRRLHDPDHPEVALVLDRLAEVMRARDAASADSEGTSNNTNPDNNTNTLMASYRNNGMGNSAWWRETSLTSRGSSWFESNPSTRGSYTMRGGGGSHWNEPSDVSDADKVVDHNGSGGVGVDAKERGATVTAAAGVVPSVAAVARADATAVTAHDPGGDNAMVEKSSPIAAGPIAETLADPRRPVAPLKDGARREEKEALTVQEEKGSLDTASKSGMSGEILISIPGVAGPSPATKTARAKGPDGSHMRSFFDTYSQGNATRRRRRSNLTASSSCFSMESLVHSRSNVGGMPAAAKAKRSSGRSKTPSSRGSSRVGGAGAGGGSSSSNRRRRQPGSARRKRTKSREAVIEAKKKSNSDVSPAASEGMSQSGSGGGVGIRPRTLTSGSAISSGDESSLSGSDSEDYESSLSSCVTSSYDDDSTSEYDSVSDTSGRNTVSGGADEAHVGVAAAAGTGDSSDESDGGDGGATPVLIGIKGVTGIIPIPAASNCWSDGVFESSGNSTPAPPHRAAAARRHAAATAAATAAAAAAALQQQVPLPPQNIARAQVATRGEVQSTGSDGIPDALKLEAVDARPTEHSPGAAKRQHVELLLPARYVNSSDRGGAAGGGDTGGMPGLWTPYGHQLSENLTSGTSSDEDKDDDDDNDEESSGFDARNERVDASASLKFDASQSSRNSIDVNASELNVWVPVEGDDRDTTDGGGGTVGGSIVIDNRATTRTAGEAPGGGWKGKSSLGGAVAAAATNAASALTKATGGKLEWRARQSTPSSTASFGSDCLPPPLEALKRVDDKDGREQRKDGSGAAMRKRRSARGALPAPPSSRPQHTPPPAWEGPRNPLPEGAAARLFDRVSEGP